MVGIPFESLCITNTKPPIPPQAYWEGPSPSCKDVLVFYRSHYPSRGGPMAEPITIDTFTKVAFFLG